MNTSSFTAFDCNWYNYDFIVLYACQYGNITESMIVAKEYFDDTSSARRSFVKNGTQLQFEIYQNGHNSIYVRPNTTDSQYNLKIYGLTL